MNRSSAPSTIVRRAGVLLLFLAGLLLTSCDGGSSSSPPPPPTSLPAKPMALSAVAGNNQVTVSWSSVSGATSYNLYYSTSPGVTKSLYDVKIASVTSPKTITSLANGTPYYFVVTAVNSLGEGAESGEITATPVDTTGMPTFTISGTVQYEDKEYGASGFTGVTKYKAVRHVYIDVKDISANTLYSTLTDDAGAFSVSVPNTVSGHSFNATAISSAMFSVSSSIGVNNLSEFLYGVLSQNFTVSGPATVNINIPITSQASGAFNILDILTSGYQFVQELSGTYPPALSAYWEYNSSYGTYYSPGVGIVIIGNYNGDTDGYDDDVIWHELGHFIADTYSKDDSPGGYHSLGDYDLDMRLAWSEGWGDFFPGAVKNWLSINNPGLLSIVWPSPPPPNDYTLALYVDTSNSSWSFDFGDATTYPSFFYYSSSETAIAKVLFDLRNAYGMPEIWGVITSYQSSIPATPVNLEIFWDRWLSQGYANPSGIFTSRLIYYQEDIHENDDAASGTRKYVPGMPETHYLYKTSGFADKDVVAFDATAGTTYTIRTQNLSNGADTYLTLLNTDGMSTISTNDNWNNATYPQAGYYDIWGNFYPPNDATTLSSRINFTPSASGTYYVEVKSSPAALYTAGRYGTYTLTITSP